MRRLNFKELDFKKDGRKQFAIFESGCCFLEVSTYEGSNYWYIGHVGKFQSLLIAESKAGIARKFNRLVSKLGLGWYDHFDGESYE